MFIGAGIIILGMILMSGGKNADPKVFDYNLTYSFMRITVAPILILLGLMIQKYMPSSKDQSLLNRRKG